MRIRIWGCRGSLAAPGPDTVTYGGNTSSVEVELSDGTLIVFDAGTGIRPLGKRIAEREQQTVHLMLTHLHLDHVEGLGFFDSIWDPDADLHIWGPPSPLHPLEERIATMMSPPLFPVNLGDAPCEPTYHVPVEDALVLGDAKITMHPVNHRGKTYGYRIEEHGRSFAYIPDHEPALGHDLEEHDTERLSGYDIAYQADVLFHDSQYSEEEYPSHRRWGHSSIAHCITFGLRMEVGNLVLFHHDPGHSDEQLEAHLKRGRELWGSHNTAPVLAREGMEIELPRGSGG